MKTLKIQIPDMQSTHCQTRVSTAIKTLQGVTIEQLSAGTVTVSLDDTVDPSTISEAVTNAGYQVAGIESSGTSDRGIKFKTNINCSGCVAKVTPALDELNAQWKVDTESQQKVLTVTTDQLSEDQIIQAVQKAGFKIEPLKN